MMIWGFNVSAIKVIIQDFMPITITALRIFTASITAFVVLGFMGIFRLPKGSEWIFILGGTVLNVVFHHYFLAAGLTRTTATNAGLILGMGPLLTVIMSMLFLRQKPTIIRVIGFILGTLGVSFTVLAGSTGISSVNLGDIQVLLSIFSQALSFILITQAAKSMDTRLLTGYMLFIGSIVLFCISLWREPNGLASLTNGTTFVWLIFLYSGVIATGLGHLIYNYAIGRVGPAESSIFLNLNTFFSILGAVIFLNEVLVIAHFIGLILIISGVILGSGGLEALLQQRKNSKQQAMEKVG